MKYGNIFWGVILITLGILFGLRSLDIFYFSWGSIFRLWPLIFIFWGISLLPVKAMAKLALTVITVVVGLLIVVNNPGRGFWYNFDNNWRSNHNRDKVEREYDWDTQYFSEDFESDKSFAILELDAAAGEFDLNGTTSKLFEFETEGNVGPFEASTRNAGEETVVVNFSQESFSGRRKLKNHVNIQLNDNPIWTLKIDAGAAKLDFDVSMLKVEKVDIDGGASAIDLKLGDRMEHTKVKIDAGVSGIEIRVPSSSACEVRTETFLTGRDLDGFNKIRDGVYQTPNFSSENKQVIIDIDAAVSGLKVVRY